MDDVHRRIRHFSNGNSTVNAFGFRFGWTCQRVIFGRGLPFSQGAFDAFPPADGSLFSPIEIRPKRLTAFAMDVGGVVEFYPTKRIVTRFDFGDTIIHFNRRTMNTVSFNDVTNTITPTTIPIPARTSHNFQFMTSVGFRF